MLGCVSKTSQLLFKVVLFLTIKLNWVLLPVILLQRKLLSRYLNIFHLNYDVLFSVYYKKQTNKKPSKHKLWQFTLKFWTYLKHIFFMKEIVSILVFTLSRMHFEGLYCSGIVIHTVQKACPVALYVLSSEEISGNHPTC